MRNFILLIFVIFVVGGIYFWNRYKGVYYVGKPSTENIINLIEKSPGPGQNKTSLPLKIPDGYSISVYSKDLPNAREMVLDPTGVIVVSQTSEGKVIAVEGPKKTVVAEGLKQPHGLAFNGQKLFIAETSGVSVYDYDNVTKKAVNKAKIIDLPPGGRHFTRSLLIKDGKLYVSIGSSCDACVEKDNRRAAIWISNLDGSDFKPFATGLRNSVFMAINPAANEIWATENGRDNLGDDLPPDEINIIKEGQFYGWPYCFGDGFFDASVNANGSKFDCAKSVSPFIKIPAHSAPLGLAFLNGDLLVSYHGSWNRTTPTGYKVVRFRGGKFEDFVTGFIKNGEVLGRPVDILVKGSDVYISDDKAGAIYRLSKI